MQVNFTREEYKRLCRIADEYNTTPAWLVHEWTLEKIAFEEYHLRFKGKGADRISGPDGTSSPIPRSHPIQEP